LESQEQNNLSARARALVSELPDVMGKLKRTMAVDQLLEIEPDFSKTLSRVCKIASLALDAPRAMVALVTGNHDLYPLQEGFTPAIAPHAHAEGPTLCHFTVAIGEPVAINDTQTGLPWMDVKSVREAGVKSYLGVPLRFRNEVVGSLCVVHVESRHWRATDVRLMQELGAWTEQEFEFAWSRRLDALASRLD
jgi:GAF domain-containing protein